LVPFVESGVAYGDEQGKECPLEIPTATPGANTMKDSDTKDAEFRDVGQFSDCGVHPAKSVRACGREYPMKEWNQDFGSFRAAEVMS
jgi:hypothetical protein